MRRVVAGICVKYVDSKPYVLLGLKPNGAWEFPGGKVESGESDENALEREWIEELDSLVDVGDHYINVQLDEYHVVFYFVELVDDENDSSKARNKEHVEVEWIGISELESLTMQDSNELVSDLLRHDYL